MLFGRVLFSFQSMTGIIHVLWSPETGTCSQCGTKNPHIRRFTSEGSQTLFCQGCWDEFMLECNVSLGTWRSDVSDNWHMPVDLSLEFDGDQDGTSQGVRTWN